MVVARHLGVAERGHIQFFSSPFIYYVVGLPSCANRAQLAAALSTGDTCTVCGHTTMIIYFTMYSYKIVGGAVIAGAYCYYLSDNKFGAHMYCLWPPHYYKLGNPTLIIVYTASIPYYYLAPSVYSQWRGDILVCASISVDSPMSVTCPPHPY